MALSKPTSSQTHQERQGQQMSENSLADSLPLEHYRDLGYIAGPSSSSSLNSGIHSPTVLWKHTHQKDYTAIELYSMETAL